MTAACRLCGSADGLRQFTGGWRCPDCTPARLAGRPEPDTAAYCPPRICWCGTCPWADAVASAPPTRTAIDTRHELSGKRFTNPREHAAARLNARSTA